MQADRLNPDSLHMLLQLVMRQDEIPSPEALAQLSPHELMLACDWAVREHLSASDNLNHRREQPWFLSHLASCPSAGKDSSHAQGQQLAR